MCEERGCDPSTALKAALSAPSGPHTWKKWLAVRDACRVGRYGLVYINTLTCCLLFVVCCYCWYILLLLLL